jgi:hypothetical protein
MHQPSSGHAFAVAVAFWCLERAATATEKFPSLLALSRLPTRQVGCHELPHTRLAVLSLCTLLRPCGRPDQAHHRCQRGIPATRAFPREDGECRRRWIPARGVLLLDSSFERAIERFVAIELLRLPNAASTLRGGAWLRCGQRRDGGTQDACLMLSVEDGLSARRRRSQKPQLPPSCLRRPTSQSPVSAAPASMLIVKTHLLRVEGNVVYRRAG